MKKKTMNVLDKRADKAALDFHHSVWPLHTMLRPLRVPCPRWILPGVAGLTREERRIVSGAMTLMRVAVIPLLVGAAVRFTASLASPLGHVGFGFTGTTVADVGLVLVALGLALMLAMWLRRFVVARCGI